MTVQELEQNAKLKFWNDHITKQRLSGISVAKYCADNNLVISTYYDYVKKIKQLLCDEMNARQANGDIIPFVSVPVKQITNTNNEKLIIIKGTVKIEFGVHTEYQVIESIIKSLLC